MDKKTITWKGRLTQAREDMGESYMNAKDWIAHHIDVWRQALVFEKERVKGKVEVEEKDFLPAALEIMETPASPAGRGTVWAISAFFVIAMLWAIFGHVDVVATASGKITPRGKVKIIQSAETGVVRDIHVKDGDHVKAGQVLLALDPTYADADMEQARRGLFVARSAYERSSVLLDYLAGERRAFVPSEGADEAYVRSQKDFINSRISEYEASLATLHEQRRERMADHSAVKREIMRLQETLPLLAEQVEGRKDLMDKGLSPRFVYLELQERYLSHMQSIEIQKDQLLKVAAGVAALDRQKEQIQKEFRKALLAELVEAQDNITLQQAELDKASRRHGLQLMKAPVDGVVQQLVVNTIGGVVQPGEPLMVIVPGSGELVAEAMLLNRDVGFVRVGDDVEVKLEAFPFTRYGVIHGTLENISMDAIQDEHMGLVYAARIKLDTQSIKADGRVVPLSSGMSLGAEIKTDERRIIQFILSPLMRYRDESLRER